MIHKFRNKTARIAILGMGYVGLPLAVVFAEAGFKVTGIDPEVRKVDLLTGASATSRIFPRNGSLRWSSLVN